MKQAILCGLALAACSGHASRPATGQSVPMALAASPPAPVAPDPARAFRLAYANPGGMWLPAQMTLPGHVEAFRKLGVALDPRTLAEPLAAPLAAVIWLGNCTASFVSAEGLIATNHHCVQGALQLNTSKQDGRNLVEDGFLARTRADERSAGPGARVFVAQAFKDVTREVRDGLEQIKDPVARKDAADRHQNALLAACEHERPGIRCNIKPLFNGAQYLQTENLELRDVRLVYAPARSVGDYGGEVDNWNWPRHTGDWAFYRAYVGVDGQPADFSPDNVPYRPAAHLQVTAAGLAPGDFVMMVGYPASTTRTQPAAAIHHDVAWTLPYQTEYLKQRYAIAEAHVRDASETGTKATVMKQATQNAIAKNEGILAGLARSSALMARKDALDQQIKAWAAAPGHEAAQQALARLEQIGDDARRTARVDLDRARVLTGSQLLASAIAFTHWADERTKPDAARRTGYQDRDLKPAQAATRQLGRVYDRTLDRATLRLALVRALQLPVADRRWLAILLDLPRSAAIDEARIDRTLDAWYAAPALEDDQLRLGLLATGTLAQLRASRDPMIRAALRVWPVVKAEEQRSDARQGELLLVGAAYVDAMAQVLGGQLAPDANASLRISYGTVRSFQPGSAAPADAPFTVGSQILAKDTGVEPFNAPAPLLAALKARRFGPYADRARGGDLPINFLTDLDITGGNSGSPILNARGELVGLAFDSTLAGIAADLVFDPATNRAIGVDARYLIWTLDLLDHGDHLLREMGLTPAL